MNEHGFFRVTAAAPPQHLSNPAANAEAICRAIDEHADSDLVVLPELCISGYCCGDLFAADTLLDGCEAAVLEIANHSVGKRPVVVVGTPLRVGPSLMNVALFIFDGKLAGAVPKTFLPNYREFYEARHFKSAGVSDPPVVRVGDIELPFGVDLLFTCGDAVIAAELCEDLWVPVPPSCDAAVAGANVLVNLSASNETIGKAEWRRELVKSQSGRLIAAYVYASAGIGESTSDLVFGGHCLIAENGGLLGQSRRIGDGQSPTVVEGTSLTRDVDLQRLQHDRRVVGTFDDAVAGRTYRRIELTSGSGVPPGRRPIGDQNLGGPGHAGELRRHVDPHPFVPADPARRAERCSEILAIQSAGLVRRLRQLPGETTLSIGVSGGLDSTLALVVACEALDHLDRPRSVIAGMTMPGFGTTRRTETNAQKLIDDYGLTGERIDIRAMCLETFKAMGHHPFGLIVGDDDVDAFQRRLVALPDDAKDLVFENVQARTRTLLLMSRGFVLGTGDMSEQALGWSTYNGDHMSMYNVNTSIPKTLVRFLVRHAADQLVSAQTNADLGHVLHAIADTPISPELLPPSRAGEIRQSTEAAVGPYELNDFFLYHFVRGGCTTPKIAYMARQAKFDVSYDDATIDRTLDDFMRRFFANQFKRNCVPDGPKVGSVSLSPRGDWRMPSDASAAAFGG